MITSRTQIILIRKSVKVKGECKKRVDVLHNMVGSGRIMFNALLDFTLRVRSHGQGDSVFDLEPKVLTDNHWTPITHNIPQDVLDEAEMDDLDTIREVLRYCENEEGAMVVELEDSLLPAKIRVGFLREDMREYVTPQAYGETNNHSNFSTSKFLEYTLGLLDYYWVQYVDGTRILYKEVEQDRECNVLK